MTEIANLFVLGAVRGAEWDIVITQVLTFTVLLVLLKKFAWGPLRDVMDERERDINRGINSAEQAKLNAQKLEEESKQKLKETQEEVQKILENAKIQACQQQEQVIHEADVRANGMIETAQSGINSQKERAIAGVNNQVSELSVLIASKVLRKEISEQDQKALVNKYLKGAGDK